MERNTSIDLIRGLVMIIMALDHVRDLLHVDSLTQSPTDLSSTTPILFFTRWITYLCAPAFVFLAGTSAFLSLKAKNNIAETRRFLIKRGLWLMLLELTMVNFGMWFDIGFSILIFEVIAAIGLGFLLLALLLKLPTISLGIAGMLILVLQHVIIPAAPQAGLVEKLISALFVPGLFPYGHGKMFLVAYPPLPWAAIMLIGFAAGRYFTLEPVQQRKLFARTGIILLICFLILRYNNHYGDPIAWSAQKNSLYTLLSFLNVSKYPPSLQFTLLFLGIMLLLLAWAQNRNRKMANFISTYGKVPLFYFLVHWYIIHPFLFLVIWLQGFTGADMVFGFNFGRPKAESGLPLWGVYLSWVVLVFMMYPLCKAYGRYKAANLHKAWLRYL